MRIYSIFNSIDGEVNSHHQGVFTTFIRTSGCNFSCLYCDTQYAIDKYDGFETSIPNILKKVDSIGCNKITITGGEPLLQESTKDLIVDLVTAGYQVTIETNGSLELPEFEYTTFMNVSWVVDYKLEYHNQMNFNNYTKLSNRDFIKCVISNKEEFLQFRKIISMLHQEGCIAKIALSPNYDKLDVNELISWCKEFKMFDVIINVQLHKLLKLSESA